MRAKLKKAKNNPVPRRKRHLLDSSNDEFDDAIIIDYNDDSIIMEDFSDVKKNYQMLKKHFYQRRHFPNQ